MNNLASVVHSHLPADGRSSRLFHGRGKKFPGLEHVNIDFFAPTILITLFKETTDDMLASIIEAVEPLLPENILLQKRYLPRPTLEVLKGEIPATPQAFEEGLKFNLKFGETQNIGFFLDMFPGRVLIRNLSKNKKVLNLFSYTCSLSVAALAGGASLVVNVDMSKAALTVGESNHHLNNLATNARFMSYDIMNSWKKIQKPGPYDLIVIDPPTNQGDSFKVDRDYYKIVKRLSDMTSDGAIVMACLNSPYLTSQFLIDLFLEHASEFVFQEVVYSAFSAMEVNPEEGLKIVMFKKLS